MTSYDVTNKRNELTDIVEFLQRLTMKNRDEKSEFFRSVANTVCVTYYIHVCECVCAHMCVTHTAIHRHTHHVYYLPCRSLPARLLSIPSQTLCRHIVPKLLTPLVMGEPAAQQYLWKHLFTPVVGMESEGTIYLIRAHYSDYKMTQGLLNK